MERLLVEVSFIDIREIWTCGVHTYLYLLATSSERISMLTYLVVLQDSRLLVGRKNDGPLMEPLPNHGMVPMRRHGIISSAGRRQHDLKIRKSGNRL
jgi:hypothetical protein